MAREKPLEPDTSCEVPTWFMTYSDVITLLMTFFILLLTFASTEPETFDRVKVTMFGFGASPGLAGKKHDAVDRESVANRYRPEVARLTTAGTETPPTNVDASRDGMGEGLKALEQESDLARFQRPTFEITRNAILKPDGTLTARGEKYVSMIAAQLRSQGMKLTISVPSADDLPAAVKMGYSMNFDHLAPIGSVAVESRPNPKRNSLQFRFSRLQKTMNGE